MSADLALFLTVMSASAFLALVALTVGSSLRQRRLARQAAALTVAVAEEIAHPGDDLMVVADAVAENPRPTLREERIPVPARPNALGGWVRIGDERVHRSCEQAYPAGLVCSYCLPILLVHARTVTP